MASLLGTKQQELEDLETVRFIATALFDVSAEKITRLRTEFERNDAFYNDIANLYQAIKQAAFNRGELPTRPQTLTKTITVAFTSNTRFYGEVNAEVINQFITRMQFNRKSDYLVIGRVGKSLMENASLGGQHVSYFEFAEDEPSGIELRRFLKNVAAYDRVLILYPSFINIYVQHVAVRDITYAPRIESPTGTAADIDYIFEPELPELLRFFETRVRYLLFQRAMLESELARTAARLISMNRAQERSDTEIAHVRQDIERDIEAFADMRLLESFAAISRWKT